MELASGELAEVVYKTQINEELTGVEEVQMEAIMRTQFSQANFIRVLFERGVASEDEFRNTWSRLSNSFQMNEWYINRGATFTDLTKQLILEDGGIEKYIQSFR